MPDLTPPWAAPAGVAALPPAPPFTPVGEGVHAASATISATVLPPRGNPPCAQVLPWKMCGQEPPSLPSPSPASCLCWPRSLTGRLAQA